MSIDRNHFIRPITSPISRRRFFGSCVALGCSGIVSRLRGAELARVLSIDARIREHAENAPLAMQFAGSTASECREWQHTFRTRLESLLGPFRPPEKWNSVLEQTVEHPDHIREERLLTAPGIDPVPVYLLRPRGAAARAQATLARLPGVVTIHGHGSGHDIVVGRDETPELKAEIARYRGDYGLELVRRGYVVAAPCLTPFGRRLSPDPAARRGNVCERTYVRLQPLGKLLVAENLRDVLWTLEFLGGQDEVDADRLGCVGLSMGGRLTMLAAAVETRIKVAVMAGILNCMQERIANPGSHGGCQTIPGLLKFGDTPEIAGLIAPRPILWTIGSRDSLVDAEWAERALGRIRRVYRAVGSEEAVQVDRFEGAHEWHGAMAYPLLQRVLRP